MKSYKKCRCGDNAYKAIYRSSDDSKNDQLLAYACVCCAPQIMNDLNTSEYYWPSIDFIWCKDLPPEDRYE